MPISLRVIERKILRYALATLTELESWMKRMVMNAKEYYPKNSQIFEDAERVRKATSNWMVKYNPAYKNSASYAATGIAVPSDYDVYAELALEDMAAEEAIGLVVPPVSAMHQQPVQNTMRGRDADREDEDMPDADAEGDAEHDSEVDAEGEEDDEGDEDDAQGEPDVSRGSGPRIVLKRGSARSQQSETTPSVSGEKEDKARYQDVPFDELNFQQAQEKIVDTLLKRTDEYVPIDMVYNLWKASKKLTMNQSVRVSLSSKISSSCRPRHTTKTTIGISRNRYLYRFFGALSEACKVGEAQLESAISRAGLRWSRRLSYSGRMLGDIILTTVSYLKRRMNLR